MEDFRPVILIVESDPALRDLMMLPLEREGFHVVTSDKGADTSRLIREHKPFLVLLDLFLPHICGLEIIKTIGESLRAHCFIIVISSLGFKEVVEQARELGARDFLVKPMDTDRLVQKVRSALADARYLQPWD